MSQAPIQLESLVSDLRKIGLTSGDNVLVHTSLKRVGYVQGGPETFIRALIETVGADGTVLFPTLTGHREDSPQNPPEFDAKLTPTTMVGVVPETARKLPGALRSTHPTHSVAAIGARAEWFCENHEGCTSPCGPGSPYHKLAEASGKILLVGCSHTNNTTLHMIEELAAVPYHLLPGRARYAVTDRQGDQVVVDTAFHSWSTKRNFEVVSSLPEADTFQKWGIVGGAPSLLVWANGLTQGVLAKLAEDPLFLVAK